MADFQCILQTDENGNAEAVNKELLQSFFNENKNSKFKIEIYQLTDHSSLLRKYYFAEVVTMCKIGLNDHGYNLNKQQTHEFIKQYSPIMVDHIELNDEYKTRFKSINELNNKEFLQYIEDIKQFAIENLDIMIKEPNE